MTSLKSRIILWLRINNINPALLKFGSETSLQRCYRWYLFDDQGECSFSVCLAVDLLYAE